MRLSAASMLLSDYAQVRKGFKVQTFIQATLVCFASVVLGQLVFSMAKALISNLAREISLKQRYRLVGSLSSSKRRNHKKKKT